MVRRACELDVELVRIDDLGRGRFGADPGRARFDLIVFAEILEHIAFNPLDMWRHIFDMLKPNGYLIVTTPNSLSLRKTYRGFRRLLSRTGQGIAVDQIFSTVTYGHHWKEYSKFELIDYFVRLGIPFENIQVDYVRYPPAEASKPKGFKSAIKHHGRSILYRFIHATLKPDLFCTVKLTDVMLKVPNAPEYLG